MPIGLDRTQLCNENKYTMTQHGLVLWFAYEAFVC
jgi:hypothetical protein